MLDRPDTRQRRLQELNTRLTYRLSRLQARLNKHAARLLAAHSDLSLSQWRVLTSIHALETTTLAELSREMQYDKAQISRSIKSLEEAGLVRQSADAADQRRVLLTLTETGQSEHGRLLPHVRKRHKVLVRGMDDREVKALFGALDKLDIVLDEEGV